MKVLVEMQNGDLVLFTASEKKFAYMFGEMSRDKTGYRRIGFAFDRDLVPRSLLTDAQLARVFESKKEMEIDLDPEVFRHYLGV
jgi:hypothetical protein